jgi:phage repressor protein C with HTH and peptisase S24 domain
MKTFADRLKALREAEGLTQAAMAKRLGVSRGALANWEVGGEIAHDNVRRISDQFDATMDWLVAGRGRAPASLGKPTLDPATNKADIERAASLGQLANATISGQNSKGWKEIPVYGQAVAGEHGEFLMNGSILFTALAPPSVVAISEAYGVRVSGSSMEPRYFDGEVVFVDPSRIARAGDFVVVQVRLDEHGELWGYVKRFVRWNTKELVLSQFNPEKQMTFPGGQVHSCHVIVMGGMG